jgi:hypothetical protein
MDEPVVQEPRSVEEPPPAKKKSRNGLWGALVVVAALIGYAVWSGVSGPEPAPTTARNCAEWTAKGSTNRVIQARTMLISLRNVDGLQAPSQSQVEQFASGLTNACEASAAQASKLSEVAAALYLTEKTRFGS